MKLPLRLFLVLALLFGLTAVASPTSTLAAGAIQQAMPDIADDGTMVFTETTASGTSSYMVGTKTINKADSPNSQARISPDGKKIAFVENLVSTCIVTIETLAKTCAGSTSSHYFLYNPHWSGSNTLFMDGIHIVGKDPKVQVYVWDLSVNSFRQFLPDDVDGTCGPMPSPDGKLIALSNHCYNNGSDWSANIYTVDGKLVSSRKGVTLAWSPDSKQIALYRYVHTKTKELVISQANSSSSYILYVGEYISSENMVDWSVNGIIWSGENARIQSQFYFSPDINAGHITVTHVEGCSWLDGIDIKGSNVVSTCVVYSNKTTSSTTTTSPLFPIN